jgi:16S rRNA (guanine966-N2)-methyltransferase
VRIISGSLRGRRLTPPPGRATRPTSELIRGAIFNSIEARQGIADAVVVDLFAGSGALGIEALSRGAARAVFVDSDRNAVAVIRANLDAFGLTDQATVHQGTVEHWTPVPADIILIDPPYEWDAWDQLLGALATFTKGIVVAESDRDISHPAWEIAAVHRHGGTVVTQLRPGGAPTPMSIA